MNLALAHNMAGQFKDALLVCDQLEKECGAKTAVTAYAHKAVTHLNLQQFDEAAKAALTIAEPAPDEGFIAGLALFELGRHVEAIQWFLYATTNSPRSAYFIVGKSAGKPKYSTEIEDYNAGLELVQSLPRFFKLQSRQSEKFFKTLVENDAVQAILAEVKQCEKKHFDGELVEHFGANLRRWNELKSWEFAKREGRKIAKELGYTAPAEIASGKRR